MASLGLTLCFCLARAQTDWESLTASVGRRIKSPAGFLPTPTSNDKGDLSFFTIQESQPDCPSCSADVPIESLRLRFALLQSLNTTLETFFLPLVELRQTPMYAHSIAALLKEAKGQHLRPPAPHPTVTSLGGPSPYM